MHLYCNDICNIIPKGFIVSQIYIFFSLQILSHAVFNFLHIQVEKWKKRWQFAFCCMLLDSELDEILWLASHHNCLTPWERTSGTHWTKMSEAWELIWMEWQRKRIPCPCQQANPSHPSHSLCKSLYWMSYPRLQLPHCKYFIYNI